MLLNADAKSLRGIASFTRTHSVLLCKPLTLPDTAIYSLWMYTNTQIHRYSAVECGRTCVSWCHSPAAQIHCSSDCCCQIPGRLWNWTLTPLRKTRLNPGLRRENAVEVLQFISLLHLLFKLSVMEEKGESRDGAHEILRCSVCLFCWQFIKEEYFFLRAASEAKRQICTPAWESIYQF